MRAQQQPPQLDGEGEQRGVRGQARVHQRLHRQRLKQVKRVSGARCGALEGSANSSCDSTRSASECALHAFSSWERSSGSRMSPRGIRCAEGGGGLGVLAEALCFRVVSAMSKSLRSAQSSPAQRPQHPKSEGEVEDEEMSSRVKLDFVNTTHVLAGLPSPAPPQASAPPPPLLLVRLCL